MIRHGSGALVIGIGNPLRGDDGVGSLLAELAAEAAAAATGPAASLAVRHLQQLTPELAEELAMLKRVLFIDAWRAPAGAEPVLEAIEPAAGTAESHRLEPAQVLAVSQVLYGRAPEAWLLKVPGEEFGHGTQLSAAVQLVLPQARQLLQSWLSGHA